MRCKACDSRLTAREATRKGTVTGDFLDLCDPCFDTIRDQIEIEDNPLNATHQQEDDEEGNGTSLSLDQALS